MARAKQYWLFKSEPDVFSIQDLAAAPKKTTYWEGVRNYQARNLLRDDIKKGDEVLYYHSRVQPIGVAGIAKVPRWYCVDLTHVKTFDDVIPLSALKAEKALAKMMVTQRGARLSIQPVTAAEWKAVLKMA